MRERRETAIIQQYEMDNLVNKEKRLRVYNIENEEEIELKYRARVAKANMIGIQSRFYWVTNEDETLYGVYEDNEEIEIFSVRDMLLANKSSDTTPYFYYSKLTKLDLRELKAPSYYDLTHFFTGSEAEEIILPEFSNFRVSVERQMFNSNLNLRKIDLNGLNISKCKYTQKMFSELPSLEEVTLDLRHINNESNLFRFFEYSGSINEANNKIEIDLSESDLRGVDFYKAFNESNIHFINLRGSELLDAKQLGQILIANNIGTIDVRGLTINGVPNIKELFSKYHNSTWAPVKIIGLC